MIDYSIVSNIMKPKVPIFERMLHPPSESIFFSKKAKALYYQP